MKLLCLYSLWKRGYFYYFDGVTNTAQKKAIGQEWKSKRFMKSLLGLVDAEEDDVFKECLQKVNAHFRATHNRLTQAETADTFIVV